MPLRRAAILAPIAEEAYDSLSRRYGVELEGLKSLGFLGGFADSFFVHEDADLRTVAHEYAHVWQLFGTEERAGDATVWLNEGDAEELPPRLSPFRVVGFGWPALLFYLLFVLSLGLYVWRFVRSAAFAISALLTPLWLALYLNHGSLPEFLQFVA